MNLFPTKPDLKPIAKPVVWTCPLTGIRVPKEPSANLQWRASMLEMAEGDEDMQRDLYTAASQSVLFFVNAFCFTLRIFEPGTSGKVQQAVNTHLPFVTWPIQDEHLLRIENAIDNGEELLTDKSRDMGATWDHIIAYVHRFLFRPDEMHLMVSRKEDAVDVLDGMVKNYPFGTVADPGTLFGKIDYVLSRLPEWMLPRMSRKKMHLVNLDTKCRIDGESANASAGSSDRRHSIFLDEMAKMDEAESIKRSTRDVTACRLVCSTPNGAGTTYSKWRMSGSIPVFVLPWWEHPEKGAGRYVVQDKLGRWKVKSPWYEIEERDRTPKELAVEIDMDHIGSGDTFFEPTTLETHKKMFCKPPLQKGTITFLKKMSDEHVVAAINTCNFKSVVRTPSGPWEFWTALDDNGRLDQTDTYTMGIDISKGQGASNSTCSVMNERTKEKVMAFADANTPPYEFARLMVAAGIWIGGRNKRPRIIFENNGDPGFDFGRQLVHIYHWPNLYFDSTTGVVSTKVGKRYGWRSNTEKKAEALGLLRRAYHTAGIINHQAASIDEALSYVHYEGGGLGPAELVMESNESRKAHGDRVIADMLCVWATQGMGKMKRDKPTAGDNTFGGRMAAFKRDKKQRDTAFPKKFDFTTG